MRGTIDALASPHPLADTLPTMLREDPFARSLCAGFDELLAPVILDLDTFVAHIDPATAPDDMLVWLAQWLGLGIDVDVDPTPQRGELQVAGAVNAARGTRRSIQLAVSSVFGVDVDVTESGGARWSPTPGGDLPGQPEPGITVTVASPKGVAIDGDRLMAVIRSVTPAHIPPTVVVQP
ncbi:MAG: phage tail protein [Micropruina sp.]|uniref:phage tail protein n=1 Tax=Micropruina sp. TaxID=2737536 RepID=UPI0039E34DCE